LKLDSVACSGLFFFKKKQIKNDLDETFVLYNQREIPDPCGERHHDVHGSQTKDDVKEAVIVNCSIAFVAKDPLSASSRAVIPPTIYC
jgi:hypothetical protein